MQARNLLTTRRIRLWRNTRWKAEFPTPEPLNRSPNHFPAKKYSSNNRNIKFTMCVLPWRTIVAARTLRHVIRRSHPCKHSTVFHKSRKRAAHVFGLIWWEHWKAHARARSAHLASTMPAPTIELFITAAQMSAAAQRTHADLACSPQSCRMDFIKIIVYNFVIDRAHSVGPHSGGACVCHTNAIPTVFQDWFEGKVTCVTYSTM